MNCVKPVGIHKRRHVAPPHVERELVSRSEAHVGRQHGLADKREMVVHHLLGQAIGANSIDKFEGRKPWLGHEVVAIESHRAAPSDGSISIASPRLAFHGIRQITSTSTSMSGRRRPIDPREPNRRANHLP